MTLTHILHRVCQQPISHRLVLGDDGEPSILRWCGSCDCALSEHECDPSTPIDVAEVPAALVAQLIRIGQQSRR